MVVVYAITNTVTGNAYIGCTKAKLSKRLREHRCLLKGGRHTSKAMQEEHDRFGIDAFSASVLQDLGSNVKLEVRRAAEQKWMDRYLSAGMLLNSNPMAFEFPPGAKELGAEASKSSPGQRWSAEANRKRSEAQKGKPKGHGAKISATKRAKMLTTKEMMR